MGCTPSIHVSQTGVVYCQDSEEGSSPINANNSQANSKKAISGSTGGGGGAGGGGSAGVSHITTTVMTTVLGGGSGMSSMAATSATTMTTGGESHNNMQQMNRTCSGPVSISEAETQTTRDNASIKVSDHQFPFVQLSVYHCHCHISVLPFIGVVSCLELYRCLAAVLLFLLIGSV